MFIMYVYILTCTIVQDTWIKGQENMARIVIYRVELWTASSDYQKENVNIKTSFVSPEGSKARATNWNSFYNFYFIIRGK